MSADSRASSPAARIEPLLLAGGRPAQIETIRRELAPRLTPAKNMPAYMQRSQQRTNEAHEALDALAALRASAEPSNSLLHASTVTGSTDALTEALRRLLAASDTQGHADLGSAKANARAALRAAAATDTPKESGATFAEQLDALIFAWWSETEIDSPEARSALKNLKRSAEDLAALAADTPKDGQAGER